MNRRDKSDWKIPLPNKDRQDQQNNIGVPPPNRHSRRAYEELMAAKTSASNAAFEALQENDKQLPTNYLSRQKYKEAFAAKNAQENNMTRTMVNLSEAETNHRSQPPAAPNSIQTTAAASAYTHSTNDDSPTTTTNSPELDVAEEGLVVNPSCCTSNESHPFTTNSEEAEEQFLDVLPGAYFIRGPEYASTTSSVDRSDLDDYEETQEGVVLEDPSEQQKDVEVLDAEKADENTDPRYRSTILELLRQGWRNPHVVHAEHVEREGAKRRRQAMVIACVCLVVVAIIAGTALGITTAGSNTPVFAPPPDTPAPTPPAHCFLTREELVRAVDDYLEDSSNDTGVALEYGWPIGNWCVSFITDFSEVFSADRNALARQFNEYLNQWDISSAVTLESMFMNAAAFNADVSSRDTSSVTNMKQTFFGATSLNIDISSWNVSSVTDMTGMFAFAVAFNQDISQWDVSKVTNMWLTFNYAMAFNQGLLNWNVGKVTRFEAMFEGATSFNNSLSI